VIPNHENIFFTVMNSFVDPGTTFQSTNQIWLTSLRFMLFSLSIRFRCFYISVIHLTHLRF